MVIDGEEGRMISRGNKCTNLNHRNVNAPVGFCPVCGEVVNENVPIRACNEGEHAKNDVKEISIVCIVANSLSNEDDNDDAPCSLIVWITQVS